MMANTCLDVNDTVLRRLGCQCECAYREGLSVVPYFPLLHGFVKPTSIYRHVYILFLAPLSCFFASCPFPQTQVAPSILAFFPYVAQGSSWISPEAPQTLVARLRPGRRRRHLCASASAPLATQDEHQKDDAPHPMYVYPPLYLFEPLLISMSISFRHHSSPCSHPLPLSWKLSPFGALQPILESSVESSRPRVRRKALHRRHG